MPPDDSLPEVLYHYTSAEGLIGIINRGCLWATDLAFLNDSTEMTYAGDIARKLLEQRATLLWPDPSAQEEGELANRARQLRMMAGYLDRVDLGKDRYPTYVACFCEYSDLLSQWRGYGVGGGYAIGFNPTLLRPTTRDSDRPTTIHKVVYGISAAEASLRLLVESLAPHGTGHPGAHSFVTFQLELVPEIARIKDPAFSEEAEWRIIVSSEHMSGQTVKHRQGSIGIVPYIELPLPAECITEIIIGPGRNQATRHMGVRDLLSRSYLTRPAPTIRESSIPYRF